MVLVYGLVRALVAALRLIADIRHGRAQRGYERLESSFLELERESKCHEVRLGEPADYGTQLRLLKAYEAKERARARWIAAARRLQRRHAAEKWLAEFRGKKLPYSFGLVDMALLLHVIDHVAIPSRHHLDALVELVRSWM